MNSIFKTLKIWALVWAVIILNSCDYYIESKIQEQIPSNFEIVDLIYYGNEAGCAAVIYRVKKLKQFEMDNGFDELRLLKDFDEYILQNNLENIDWFDSAGCIDGMPKELYHMVQRVPSAYFSYTRGAEYIIYEPRSRLLFYSSSH